MSDSAGTAELLRHALEQNQLLIQQLHQQPRANHPTSRAPEPISKPPTFDGANRANASTWLSQMCLYLAAYPDTFATDEAKFVCLASYLL